MDKEEFYGKTIIGWFSYGNNPSWGFVYPRFYRSNNGEFELINKEDFPHEGNIAVRMSGGITSDKVCEKNGNLVEVRINCLSPNNNQEKSIYFARFNDGLQKNISEICIESFSYLGRSFLQVVDITDNAIIEDVLMKKSFSRSICYNIYTQNILIKFRDSYYGPFECKQDEERKYSISALKENDYKIAEFEDFDDGDGIFEIQNSRDIVEITLVKKEYVNIANGKTTRDLIDDEKLIDIFVPAIKMTNPVYKSIMSTSEIKSIFKDNTNFNIDEGRQKRIENILLNNSRRIEGVDNIFKKLIECSENNEDWRSRLVDMVAKYGTKINEEAKKKNNEIFELENKKLSLEKEINNLNISREEIILEEKQKINKEIEKLELNVSKLREEESVLIGRLGIEKDIEKLKEENKKLETRYDILSGMRKEVEQKIESFKQQATMAAKAFDAELLKRVIRVAQGDKFDDVETKNIQLFDNNFISDYAKGEDIITHVYDFLNEKAFRNVSRNDVINYLICLSQGFITTFAGEPGCGKTSICNLLAKALGLCGRQNRFVDVSVERGWTSHKDFIGYYNPLTRNMEKSNSNVFNALEEMDKEVCDKISLDKLPMFLMLLDEANLSSIEHYWAIFLKNCDFDSTHSRTFNIGGSKTWNISNSLRFLATVNFDHTTEELSPRFLDRSWVISLNSVKLLEGSSQNRLDIKNSEKVFSFENIQNEFGAAELDYNSDNDSLTMWYEIKRIFEIHKLNIMPRNSNMVNDYISRADLLMDKDSQDTKLSPIDYAFSQKILPTINGMGDSYKRLIEDLKKKCKGMPITISHLDRMLVKGDGNMGYYQFFSR